MAVDRHLPRHRRRRRWIGARRLSADPSMWRDEAWTWLAIDRHLAGVLDVVVSDEANMGPYYVGLRIWSTLGSSDAWLRGFSVLGGVLAAVTLFAFIAEYFDRRAALLGVVLLVTNPVFVTYLTQARAYSWSMFLAVISTFSLLRAFESDGDRWTVVFGVTTGLALAVNLVAAFILVAQLAGVWWGRPSLRRSARVVGLGGAIRGCRPSCPFVGVTIARRGDNLSWVKPLTRDTVVDSLESVVGGRKWVILLLIGIALLAAEVARHSEGTVAPGVRAARVALVVALLPTPLLVAASWIEPVFRVSVSGAEHPLPRRSSGYRLLANPRQAPICPVGQHHCGGCDRSRVLRHELAIRHAITRGPPRRGPLPRGAGGAVRRRRVLAGLGAGRVVPLLASRRRDGPCGEELAGLGPVPDRVHDAGAAQAPGVPRSDLARLLPRKQVEPPSGPAATTPA